MKFKATSNKLPLPYISYSQWWLFKRDPEEYFQQYYIARVDEQTDPMLLGKIFQEAWCDPEGYDYAKELWDAGFTPDKARIMKTALDHPYLIKAEEMKETEKEIKATPRKKRAKELGLTYTIMGVLDGWDGRVIENKFGAPWSQQRADEAEQATWYALLTYIEEGTIPEIILQSINSRHGIPSCFRTKRNKNDLKQMVEEINNMVKLLRAGDFTQRA